MKRIVVTFHIGRSGSTVVGDLLSQHSQIFWDSESFEWVFQEFEKNSGRKFKQGDMAIDLDSFIKNKIASVNEPIWGMEVKPYHLKLLNISWDTFMKTISEHDASFIILKRNNYLRKIVSSMIAHQTGVFHYSNNSIPKSKIRIDPNRIDIDRTSNSLIGFLNEYNDNFRHLDSIFPNGEALHLSYEDDVKDNPFFAYKKICAMLNIAPEPAKINFKRINKSSLSDIIINYDEICQVLSKTKYRFFVYD